MAVYAGLDVHRKRTQVAIIDETGQQVMNRNVGNFTGDLARILADLEPGTSVAFEAGYGWSWLVELLESFSLDIHLAHPGGCKAIASARLKDDRVDARTLAHLLRTDLLPEAWIAPTEVRELRSLLRFRAAMVRSRSAWIIRIHAVLADRGLVFDGTRLDNRPGRRWLEQQDLPKTQATMVEHCLRQIDGLNASIKTIERALDRRTEDPRVQALCSLPGIGELTALMIVAEIGDIGRFPTARKLCSWAGLTPVVRNSAETVRHGHISKQGSTWIRWVLVEAAHVAKMSPPFASFFGRTARRRGKNIATVAVARKLLSRCFYVLKEVQQAEQASVSGELEV